MNRNKIERSLQLLKNEHQIEQQTTNKFRLITIINWDKYQKNEQQSEQQVSNKRATSEHKQECNNEKKKRKNKEKSFLLPVLPPHDVLAKYMEELLRKRYLVVTGLDDHVEKFLARNESSPPKNWKLAACTWISNGALWGDIQLDDERINPLPKEERYKIRGDYYKKWSLDTWKKKIKSNEKTAQDMCDYNTELYSQIF